MNRQRVRVAAAVVVVLVVLAGIVVVAGLGPFGGNSDNIGDFPTATPPTASGANGGSSGGGGSTGSGGSGGGGGSGGSAATTPPPPFSLRVDSIEPCGDTCRKVTATLTNNQDRQSTGVTVYTRIFAGNGTDGDVVWQGKQAVGSLGAGQSFTSTRTVDLGYGGGLKVQQNGGYVTIQTTVQTDQRTVTFVTQRDVA